MPLKKTYMAGRDEHLPHLVSRVKCVSHSADDSPAQGGETSVFEPATPWYLDEACAVLSG